jgi:hypothetical protein
MKFNLKMIAVAVAMVSAAGAANAALTGPDASTGGSLALVAFNDVTKAWYIRDLGVTLNSFLPSSVTTLAGDEGVTGNKTPGAGLSITKATGGYENFGDSSFSSWVTTQGAANVRWMISASDNLSDEDSLSQARLLTTSANAAQTASNGQVDNYVSSGNAGGLVDLFGDAALYVTGTDPISGFNTNFGLGAMGLATLDSAASLFYFARSSYIGGQPTAATKTQFGNADQYASFTLAANGDLSYSLAPATSAVPVPAAAWLLGSGLLAMCGAIRRRKAAAQG